MTSQQIRDGNSSRYHGISIVAGQLLPLLDLLRFDQQRFVRVGRHPVAPARCIDFLEYLHGAVELMPL
jgi:hypothetical protein